MKRSMSQFVNKDAYYKAVIGDMQAQIDTAIIYITATKKSCGMATEPKEEHLACWDAITSAPSINGNSIVVKEIENATD